MSEAAGVLAKAGRTKYAALMVLVVTHRGGELPLGEALPTGVIAVDSPALQVREALQCRHHDVDQVLLRQEADA